MYSEFISMSSLVSQLIFVSKTKERRISKETKTVQNSRTIVQKSTLRIAKLIVKSHLSAVWIYYQNRSFFYQISTPKVYRKQTSSCDAVLASKVFQNGAQKASKMLYRNCGKRPWDLFGHIKVGSWSQRHSPVPPEAHFDLIWRPIGPHFLPLQAALTSLRGQFCLLTAVHNSCREFIVHRSEHKLVRVLIVHHSIIKITAKRWVLGFKDTPPVPPEAHFDLIWRPLGP